jgi:hypothetical protein
MYTKKMLSMFLLLSMILAIFSTLQTGIVTSSSSEIALIEVSATSPHIANGTDYSEVVVTARDVYGNPVVGANITALKCMGIDSMETFNVTDNGDGTYSTLVNSTIAGNATIVALDLTTDVSGNTTVVFETGPVADIVLDATKPRDIKPRNASYVRALAVDACGNQILSPCVNITITSDFGVVSPTSIEEHGIFKATVSSNQLGIANVTATDVLSGKNKTISVIFPALSVVSPTDSVLLNDIFTQTINVFVPEPHALGFYDLKISFNSTIIRFINITDGDPYDEFDAPHLEVIDDNTLRINQTNEVSMTSPTGSVDIANITFVSVATGYSQIAVTPWNDLESSLVNTYGNPLPKTPKVEEKSTTKKKMLLRLNPIVVEDSGVDEAVLKETIKSTQEIFNNARGNCLAIQLAWDGQINWITKAQWKNIDKNNDQQLDDMPHEGFTERPEAKALLAMHRKVCYANAYWVPACEWALGWGLEDEWIILAKAAKDYYKGKVFAHELGHFLGVKSGNIDVYGKNGLMEYGDGTHLSEAQCTEMMKSKHLIDEEPDFGDAPDPKYPSNLASDGARHLIWNYEWLGKTADPTPSVNGEPNSKQVDLDEFDDGVTIAGNLVLGGNVIIGVTISTSGEKDRYKITDLNKVMYLNAWIDWNRDGDWEDGGEKIISSQKFAGPSTPVYVVPIPDQVSPCDTWLRFRLDYGENVGVKGQARYGEVEDYKIKILSPTIPPNAEFTPPDGAMFYVCDTIPLDGSASTDGFDALPCPGHICPITEWKWDIDIGNDGSIDFTLYGEISSFHCNGPGPVGITLTVTAPDPTPPTAPDYVDHDSEKHVIMQVEPTGVDVFTERGGIGPLGTYPFGWSDAYGPQEEVCTYAKVTYNGEPVENKPVGFEMIDPNGTSHDFRVAFTGPDGIATVCFRIPWEGSNAEDLFGNWSIVGTVDIAEITLSDTVKFRLGYIIEITQVKTVDINGNSKTTFAKGEHIYFNLTVQNIAFTSKVATITIVVYDECRIPIGLVILQNWTIGPGSTEIFIIDLQIPEWTFVGTAKTYANALTDMPQNGGTPTCPEKTTTFIITKP